MQKMDWEKQKLAEIKGVIRENIAAYENIVSENGEQIKELFIQVYEGERELYTHATDSQGMQGYFRLQLAKNRLALEAPYFGRIDVQEKESAKKSYYIGKRGILDTNKDIVVVDWRARIATVYYDNQKGICEYRTEEEEQRLIELLLKRSYVIEKGELQGYFDSDAVVNDELLIKYLSRNTKAVLSDIISTIQTEQNAIIRAMPFENMIVQGVAGSGKTSVIVHRIAYILYNYAHRFKPASLCIVGGSDRLVNYITSGLPELDVYHVNAMRMDELLVTLLGNKWKKKYKRVPLSTMQSYKTGGFFIAELEAFLEEYRRDRLDIKPLRDRRLGMLLKSSTIAGIIEQFPELSLNQFYQLFDDRVKEKIISVCGGAIEIRNRKLKEYGSFFQKRSYKGNLTDIYLMFLEWFGMRQKLDVLDYMETVQKQCFDLYDMAALVLIYYRIGRVENWEEYDHLFIDEAQDYGMAVYHVLKKCLPKTYFNIVGDVSQNINYHGLNDWKELRQVILKGEKEPYFLSKSYRNTIEISNFAGEILDKAGAGVYRIMPVIRHGREVETVDVISNQEGVAILEEKLTYYSEQGYQTIAIICFDGEVESMLRKKLGKYVEEVKDKQIVSILTIEEAKGLEFDAVLVWRPDRNRITTDVIYAKKVYVAATRALHELCIIR